MTLLTTRWEAPTPAPFAVEFLPVQGWTNHGRYERFARSARGCWEFGAFDAVVGFHKMPGLDFYFAGDPCYLAKTHLVRPWLYRLSPRYRTYTALERAVFGPGSHTRIMVLSEGQKQTYREWWGTPDDRFVVLPPGISHDRRATPESPAIRRAFREEWGIEPRERVVLLVGSGFKTKGLDRALKALAALPAAVRDRSWLFVVGRGSTRPYARLAARLGIAGRLRMVGGRDDVTRFLLGADLLLHPAYTETYGLVLLEAMAAGLPVLVTATCGYAYHVQRAEAGLVVPEPFDQSNLDARLAQMLGSLADAPWRANGLDYIARTDVFGLPERAADLIESGPGRGGADGL